jgi:predicted Zn-dependent peptidase
VLSNGVNIVLQENFRMPVVIVGVIFHTGFFHSPLHKRPITTLIAENFISDVSYMKLLDLGISYQVNVHGTYTEIVAEMNPKHLNRFLQIICENEFVVKDFEVQKKQLLIDGKLARDCHLNEVSSKILAEIHYKNYSANDTFNEAALATLTQKDVEKYFYQHYKK